MPNLNTASTSASTYDNRMFVYEVEGLGNKSVAGVNADATRKVGRSFISVSYSRMNQEMQRILRLGGKIVAIHPAESFAAPGDA
ncbi:MAG: photosystem I reaction center subunit XII [Oscillatoriales cyanobacterium]|jgi:CpcD/allophycocyanin linker domain|nr:MAG: photosystem I reaction center subunit XII [Oscillatoriales cyanobacterium]